MEGAGITEGRGGGKGGGFDGPRPGEFMGAPGGNRSAGLADTSGIDSIAPLPKSPLELPPSTPYFQIDVRWTIQLLDPAAPPKVDAPIEGSPKR
jgi:hypothetical protein